MSNPTFKPSEGKREEFRKYLEKNGVLDALTKVLVNLYEELEKPEDALEYIRDKLATQAGLETLAQMKAKQTELELKIASLEEELVKANSPPEEEEEPVEAPPEIATDVPEEEVPAPIPDEEV